MTTPSSTPSDVSDEPSGLPDSVTLARLANEMFAEHMGHAAASENVPWGLVGEDPPVAPAPADVTSIAPSVVPLENIPNSLDEGAEVAPLPMDSDPSGLTTLVPANVFDRAVPVRTSVPSAPFYFLDEATGVPNPNDVPVPLPSPGLPRPDFYFVRPDQPLSAPASASAPERSVPFDPQAVRRDFPILAERVNGRPLVWFDNAATTQKPRAVIERLTHFYEHENSNIHRAAHELAARATDAYEGARDAVAGFLGAPSSDDIVFVRGTTEAINLVAKSWGRANVGPGDEIVISHLEHHANIVPWQQLAAEQDARLRVIPVDDSGQILLDEYRRLLNDRTRLVAVTHVSNALGTVVPVHQVVEQAHAAGARVLIDGAQSVPHLRVDVQSLDPDFYVFSGHKIFGPTGIGALYGKHDVLESMPPWEGGGNMIQDVTFERTIYQPPPTRFEAGTGNIADAVGLGAALDYLQRIGIDNVTRYERALLNYATEALQAVPGLRLIGTAPDKASVLSFVLDGYQPEEVGTALNRDGIAVRAGHHCAQPILRRMGLEATVRASLSMYNTCDEVDTLVAALHQLAADKGHTRR
ncbi:MAG: family 2A encapsulin nanocompartment cargo protein cysteine desulfurase [Acidimicrobiales bacterium]